MRRRDGDGDTIALGYLPQSLNRTAHAHWSTVYREKQQLQRDLGIVLLAARPRLPRPFPGPVLATAVLLVPDRRRRDEGNFRAPLEKALGDALQAGGWLPDDTPDWFTFGALTFEYAPGVCATRVRLVWGSGQGEGAEGASDRTNGAREAI